MDAHQHVFFLSPLFLLHIYTCIVDQGMGKPGEELKGRPQSTHCQRVVTSIDTIRFTSRELLTARLSSRRSPRSYAIKGALSHPVCKYGSKHKSIRSKQSRKASRAAQSEYEHPPPGSRTGYLDFTCPSMVRSFAWMQDGALLFPIAAPGWSRSLDN